MQAYPRPMRLLVVLLLLVRLIAGEVVQPDLDLP